jgi:hypothetical protein
MLCMEVSGRKRFIQYSVKAIEFENPNPHPPLPAAGERLPRRGRAFLANVRKLTKQSSLILHLTAGLTK